MKSVNHVLLQPIMKKLLLLPIILCASICLHAQTAQKIAQELFDSTKTYISSQSFCQIVVHNKKYFDYKSTPDFEWNDTIISANDKILKRTMCFFLENDTKILRDKDKMILIDEDEKRFYTFLHSRKEESEYVFQEDQLRLTRFNMAPCFAPWMNSFRGNIINTPALDFVSDTSISGVRYRVIHGRQDFVDHYELKYYVNPRTHIIERLEKNLIDSAAAQRGAPSRIEVTYFVSSQNRSNEIANLFSKSNPIYGDYEYSDNTGIVQCKEDLKVGDTLSGKVLDFALECVDGGRTTLREQQGYILLDFFHNHCQPCIKFMNEQIQERDSLGETRLEKNGITVLSLNTLGRNAALTQKVLGERIDYRHVFLAFGLQEHIKVLAYPMFVLVSPDKRVLLVTYRNESDYINNIIKAKCTDEKNNHSN